MIYMLIKNKVSLLPHTVEEIFGLTPSDPQTKGWEITKLEVDKQWAKSTGDGVTVGVIDTGCDKNHPDISKNIIGGYNFISNNSDFMDDNGHGSHVCGTIAASDNNKGIVGVAPKSKIHALKVMDSKGNGRAEHIVMAIDYCIYHNIDIITMSLGSKYDMPILQKAISRAYNNNILIFCAAGNSGINEDIMYPARDKHTVSIGAIDEGFNRTSFTCSGDRLDFLAPGHDIMSILPGNRYAYMSGTSMSNPFAVGCAALYLAYIRQQSQQKYISQSDMINLFKKSTIELRNPAFRSKKYQGYGIIKPDL